MEFFFSNIFIVYFLHQDNILDWCKAIRFFFNFYPAYHFSKIYGDIALKSCKHYSLQEGRWIEVFNIFLINPFKRKYFLRVQVIIGMIYLKNCMELFNFLKNLNIEFHLLFQALNYYLELFYYMRF